MPADAQLTATTRKRYDRIAASYDVMEQPMAVGLLMDAANPPAVRVGGANINRRTMDNIESAALRIEWVEDLSVQGIFKLIVAKPASQ